VVRRERKDVINPKKFFELWLQHFRQDLSAAARKELSYPVESVDGFHVVTKPEDRIAR
jgi:hypothetical protein